MKLQRDRFLGCIDQACGKVSLWCRKLLSGLLCWIFLNVIADFVAMCKVLVICLFQMVGLSRRVRAAQRGTAPIHPRPALASRLSRFRSTRTSPPALFPSATQMPLCGPTMCSLKPASHLQLPSQKVGHTAWTHRAQAATPMSTTSTILTPTPTSMPDTTTPCSSHTQPTAQRWTPGLTLCCSQVWGTTTSQLPAQGAPHTARGWRQRWIPAATAPSRPPLSPGPPQPSMDLWRCMTQVERSKQIWYSNFTCILILCTKVIGSCCFLSCSSRSNQSKDFSLVLTDALKIRRNIVQFTPKRTCTMVRSMHGCNTSTIKYNVDRRLTDAQTQSPALSTSTYMDMNSGFGQRSNALAADQSLWGMIQTDY